MLLHHSKAGSSGGTICILVPKFSQVFALNAFKRKSLYAKGQIIQLVKLDVFMGPRSSASKNYKQLGSTKELKREDLARNWWFERQIDQFE